MEYLHDHTHCLSFDGFERATTLDENQTKVILRTLKYQLEEYLKTELSDDVFTDIILRVPYLYPARPLGCFSLLGFVRPLEDILKKHGYPEIIALSVMNFFLFRNEVKRFYDNILLFVPHSSTAFPKGYGASFNDLDQDERLLIDYYTDELFVPSQPQKRISSAVFPYCRLYCDVERLRRSNPNATKEERIRFNEELAEKYYKKDEEDKD